MKRCENCGSEFEPYRDYQRFCSSRCQRTRAAERRRAKHAPRRCEWCGEEYVPYKSDQRFCSTAHTQAAHNSKRVYGDAETAEIADTDLIDLAEKRGYLIHKPRPPVAPVVDFDTSRLRGERTRVAVISDTHFGSKYQQPTLMQRFLAYAVEQEVSAILHCGDVTDGPFKRHRNPHEVWLHTFPQMVRRTPEFFPELDVPYFFISGNHDDWYLEDGGPDVVEAICEERDDFNYIGKAQGFIRFGDVTVELAHPNEGISYALSYKLQKHIEGMPPEEKPHIYLAGNYHKAAHLPGYRNVEGFILPAYQSRSHWMRGKRLASVVGGIILEFGLDAKGLAPSLQIEWVLERMPYDNDWPGSEDER